MKVNVTKEDISKAYDHQTGWWIDARYTPIMFALKRLGVPVVSSHSGHLYAEGNKLITILPKFARDKEVEFGHSRVRERRDDIERRRAAANYFRMSTGAPPLKGKVSYDWYDLEPYSFDLEIKDAPTD